MASKFVLKKAAGGQFMFNLVASNGRIVLTSERYKSKASAANGIKSVKKHAKAIKNFERGKTKNGGTKFVLKASNGEPVGRSQTYKGPSGCTGGIASVKRCAPGSKVDDLT
ncbi:MAG: YegP family protein [Acidobacteria bacterium]|uniref:YegP family protein n=1 Tax=Candidatus Polarisedimenticola svalbardensis TaxID=2886004 RepID=A0A8J6XTM3_9BACT|nr:YegP family protein [Candidatus Polarisedimenticola svalbardensis]